MLIFIEIVCYWQEKSGVSLLVIVLIGFFQGVIMLLESIKVVLDLVLWVIVFNGCYVMLLEMVMMVIIIYLIYGGEDWVIDLVWVVLVEEVLQQVGGDVILDIVDDFGYVIDDCSMQLVIECLCYIVLKYYFDEVLSGSMLKGDDIIEML